MRYFSSGCGHNALVFSSGTYANVGFDPNTNKAGVQYIDGEQLTLVEKDNAKITVELTDSVDETGKSISKISKIVYEVKEQVTQADVNLAEVKKNEN